MTTETYYVVEWWTPDFGSGYWKRSISSADKDVDKATREFKKAHATHGDAVRLVKVTETVVLP